MTEERVYRIYQLDGVVTTVDAQLGLTQIDEHFEPAKQIAIADRLVITKTDLAAPEAVARLRARLGAAEPRSANPRGREGRSAGVRVDRARRARACNHQRRP